MEPRPEQHTRKVKRVRRDQVITVTIPIVLKIDVNREDGKMLVGVSGPPGMIVSDPEKQVD